MGPVYPHGRVAKPQRFTGLIHYMFSVVTGRARLTVGDRYTVPETKVLMAQGYSTEVPHGNYYSFRNADAAAPTTILFYKTRGPAPLHRWAGGGSRGAASRQ
jgi:hypothetical protein